MGGPSERIAIATLCIGEKYHTWWQTYAEKNWRSYATRHGYALEVFTDPLDLSKRAAARSPAWQKCLVLSHPRTEQYDRVIWIDSDIVINARAPAIHEQVVHGKVGAVVSGDNLQSDIKAIFVERMRGKSSGPGEAEATWAADQRYFYMNSGISCVSHDIVQTGVMVLDREHRSLLESVYAQDYPPTLQAYEQIPLSAQIINKGLLQRIDTRFNLLFFEQMVVYYPFLLNHELPNYKYAAYLAVMAAFGNSWFLHFAYQPHFVQFLHPDVSR